MSGISISAFQEPDDFLAALKQAGYRQLLVLEPGAFRARSTTILLHHMRLSHCEERLARIAFLALAPAITRVLLPVSESPIVCGGVAVGEGLLLTHGGAPGVYERVTGPSAWRDIALSSRHLSAFGRAYAGAPLNVPAAVRLWRPPPHPLKALLALHAAATRLTERRPRELHSEQASHGLEQELIGLLLECLCSGQPAGNAADAEKSAEIAASFERAIAAQREQFANLQVICRELDIGERALRRFCRRQLGLSPARYLHLCHMQLAHRALRNPASCDTTVHQVAYRHGFSQMGRFAASYRMLYGEPPYATLQRNRAGTGLA